MLTFLNVKLNPTFFSLIEIKSIFFLRMRVQQCVCIRLIITLLLYDYNINKPNFAYQVFMEDPWTSF